MKKFLTLLLAGATTLASAQKKSNLSRSIDDDGETLHIRVTGDMDGRVIDYDRRFQVSDLTDDERAALSSRILDSLSISMELPVAPVAPVAPAAPVFAAITMDEADLIELVVDEDEDEGEETTTAFSRTVAFDDEKGEMFLQYRFFKHGEEFIYEKTVDVEDKSDSDRQRIIHDFENEIELPGSSI